MIELAALSDNNLGAGRGAVIAKCGISALAN
jgi:hypothetical protein